MLWLHFRLQDSLTEELCTVPLLSSPVNYSSLHKPGYPVYCLLLDYLRIQALVEFFSNEFNVPSIFCNYAIFFGMWN